MKKLLLITFLFSSFISMGQTGLFQDAKGESALKLFGNSVAISTQNESINFAAGDYYRTIHSLAVDRFHRWSATLELKANEGLSNLKDGNKYLIDGSMGLYHGWKKVPSAVGTTAGWALERFISASIGVDRNKLFDTGLPPKDMVYSKGQLVYKFEFGQFGYTGNLLYGVSTSYKQQTNVDEIKTKSVNFLNYISANDSTLIFREKQAYDIKEFRGNQHAWSVNADGAFLLNESTATGPGNGPPAFLAIHFRYQLLEYQTGQFNPAIGFYLGRHGAPRTIIGGFNIQFLDIFNGMHENTNTWDRATINFVVGFKLSN